MSSFSVIKIFVLMIIVLKNGWQQLKIDLILDLITYDT